MPAQVRATILNLWASGWTEQAIRKTLRRPDTGLPWGYSTIRGEVSRARKRGDKRAIYHRRPSRGLEIQRVRFKRLTPKLIRRALQVVP